MIFFILQSRSACLNNEVFVCDSFDSDKHECDREDFYQISILT